MTARNKKKTIIIECLLFANLGTLNTSLQPVFKITLWGRFYYSQFVGGNHLEAQYLPLLTFPRSSGTRSWIQIRISCLSTKSFLGLVFNIHLFWICDMCYPFNNHSEIFFNYYDTITYRKVPGSSRLQAKREMLHLKKYQVSQRNTLKTVNTWLSHLPWHILWLYLHAGVHLNKHHKFYLVKVKALVISNDYIILKV